MSGRDTVWQPRIGAPRGNRNALKHGRHANAGKEHGRELAALRRRTRDLKRRAARMLAYTATKIDARGMSCEYDGHAPVPNGQPPHAGSPSLEES